MNIPVYTGKVPCVTTRQMIEVDRAMIEDFHIELIQMMENAGRNLAHLARVRFLDGNPEDKKVVVLAGRGGNGGGAGLCPTLAQLGSEGSGVSDQALSSLNAHYISSTGYPAAYASFHIPGQGRDPA